MLVFGSTDVDLKIRMTVLLTLWRCPVSCTCARMLLLPCRRCGLLCWQCRRSVAYCCTPPNTALHPVRRSIRAMATTKWVSSCIVMRGMRAIPLWLYTVWYQALCVGETVGGSEWAIYGLWEQWLMLCFYNEVDMIFWTWNVADPTFFVIAGFRPLSYYILYSICKSTQTPSYCSRRDLSMPCNKIERYEEDLFHSHKDWGLAMKPIQYKSTLWR